MLAMSQAKPLIFLNFLAILLLLGSAPGYAASHTKAHAKATKAAKTPAKAKDASVADATDAAANGVADDADTTLGDADFNPSDPPRQIRVLVALGASTFFFQHGRPHGVEYSMLQEFETWLNRSRGKNGTPIKFTYLPVDAGELLPQLRAGKGDLAAGLIPASAGLNQLAATSTPYLKDTWCVVQPKGAASLSDWSALSGHALMQPPASYARRVVTPDVKVQLQEAGIGTTAESILGELKDDQATLASRYITKLWSKRFAQMQVDACAPDAVEYVWAMPQDKPVWQTQVNQFLAAKGDGLANRALAGTQRYITKDSDGHVSSPEQLSSMDKLGFFAPMFQLVATANNMDWLLLAAIGQKETSLNPVVRTKGGPTGLMQINPLTARKMGVTNPHDNQQNVTAAARYLGYLRDMFTSPSIRPDDQMAFMIAAYNAGEGRIQQLRKKAAAQGLDPDKWNGNVEKVARQSVGTHLLAYVNSVGRIYSSYQSASKVASAPEVAERDEMGSKETTGAWGAKPKR
ncbi:Membrane-bound lytic murein transglycosylase F precursor [Amantichitinum ursilacus]|uniref:Membrane-bound lytic murein transglycosylase F n=2 Tax=Amantichitinum ursilacus TaxID=857265 RepID=A0A0N0GR14_9NEIS|nr:Membrane-bound lytic murein transglycosylase F precursor [Amantichitinum ursilacus]